jgi:CRISPR-associated protein Cst2
MNLAKGLEPYRHNAVFTQSPLAAEGSAYKNATTSALLHRETAVTPFQYPFALNLNDCAEKPEWTRALLKAIGELNEVAGNHARSYFEMAPASIVVRLTDSLVAGYSTYGFQKSRKTDTYEFPEVIDGILHQEKAADGSMTAAPDYPGSEFYIGGRIVKEMADDKVEQLRAQGVTVDRDPRRLIETVAAMALGGSN